VENALNVKTVDALFECRCLFSAQHATGRVFLSLLARPSRSSRTDFDCQVSNNRWP
jgi:hypothetical protein